MIANYHTHTMRCNHADGSDENYVQQAIQCGYTTLGFSDHTPYPFHNGYRSRIRMDMEELSEYCHSLNALKSEYQSKIEILIGLEAEYYPAHFDDLMKQIKDSDVQYMILGQHWNQNEYDGIYNGRPTDDEDQLRQYCYQILQGLQTGVFSYVAHPDLINFIGDTKIYESYIRDLCREIKALDIPLEINLGGLRAHCHYPNKLFWQIAAEFGCRAVIGIDAHRPEHLNAGSQIEMIQRYLKELGIEIIEKISLRSVR